MNGDAKKLKQTVHEFIKTLPEEKINQFKHDAAILESFLSDDIKKLREKESLCYEMFDLLLDIDSCFQDMRGLDLRFELDGRLELMLDKAREVINGTQN